MINLIPPEAQKSIRREYRMRALSVWSIFIALGLVLSTVLLLPAYVLISGQSDVYATAYNDAENQVEEFKEIEKKITESNQVAKELQALEVAVPISEYIEVVKNSANTGILITSFNTNIGDAKSGDSISIAGEADNRQVLSEYKNSLEETGYFVRVELPLSSLASETDIKFTMQLVITESKKS
ncbi:hypothetical protein KC845_03380 [Candidatus Kaiserbacteria bacterium]|nr:hypothetical protein [Candidatus Kaiserbacteria bacterium]